MDWNLFWNAFGAIGTTLGSLITACAVIIAVKQYRQPLEKHIKVSMISAGTQNQVDQILLYHCISIKNKGIREVQINSISIQVNDNKKLILNGIQDKSDDKINLPVKIEPEECKKFWFEVDEFSILLKRAIHDNFIQKDKKLIICATDSLGDDYLCKTNLKIKSLLNETE